MFGDARPDAVMTQGQTHNDWFTFDAKMTYLFSVERETGSDDEFGHQRNVRIEMISELLLLLRSWRSSAGAVLQLRQLPQNGKVTRRYAILHRLSTSISITFISKIKSIEIILQCWLQLSRLYDGYVVNIEE